MNNFQIILLALAILFNSWSTYLNAGIVLSREPFVRKMYFTGIMFFLQFIMAGVGIWAGNKFCSADVRVNMMISLSIFLVFGLKILLLEIRTQADENAFDFTDNKVVMFAALAEGITPLFIGTAIGVLSLHPYMHWMGIGIFLLAGILIGLWEAKRMGSDAFKLRFGPIGGLLLLAAAIKLILNLTSFGI
ncbi:MAG: manganese efflux pump [Bacteroidales bacterium]|nr:manganese efflux pump [Bacteroidales bacterium]